MSLDDMMAQPDAAATKPFRVTSRGEIISRDPRLMEVLETIDRIARSSCTVLVTGESGTGKELIVAALHDASTRHGAPLVTINCGAIPNDLVESELFGHAKGAFTGAANSRRGLVAAAEGGTLFLDEVGELPLAVQVKLLRLLQQREYSPLGEAKSVKCDVRIAAATNRNLEAEVKAGRFREDLFYRLNVIHLELPPLRRRQGDVRLLAEHLSKVLAERSGRDDLKGLAPEALEAIEAHSWPGNVRELENALERGVLLARGPCIEAADVLGKISQRVKAPETAAPSTTPNAPTAPTAAAPEGVIESPAEVTSLAPRTSNSQFPRSLPEVGIKLFTAVDNYQNDLIRQALARTGGNRNRAARLLGVNRTTLVEMIRRRNL